MKNTTQQQPYNAAGIITDNFNVIKKQQQQQLCVWRHGCDPRKVSNDSRLAVCQTLSIECSSPIFFVCLVLVLVCFHALVGAL